MSEKECGHDDEERQTLIRRLLVVLAALVVLVLFIVFLVWLILHPTKPYFVLQDATVFAFNISPPFLTSNLQVTLASTNPNDRVGVYYDHIDVYASYRGQQITLATLLPSSYQGHKDQIIWSPFLYGDHVPIAPYLGEALYEDQIAGVVMVDVRVNGRVRWKVGTFVTGPYHLEVTCPAYISLGSKNGIPIGPMVKFQVMQRCHS